MISDIPTGFCNTDLIFIFLKYFFYFLILSYIFLYFNLQMLLQISYTYMMGKRKKMEFSVRLNW